MTKISVALAVYNEAENLKRCLESVKDLAWEIVVVDGGSKDQTTKIARDFGARVILTDNPANFHINKNKAIDAAKGDWILQLDADEVVSAELQKEIIEAVAKTGVNGYWIPRKNFFLGRFLTKGGQYPDYTLRLYRKGQGKLPARDVHEQAEVVGKVGYLKNNLLHLRDQNFANYMQRFNRYTSLFAKQLEESGIKINVFIFINFTFLLPFFWFIRAYLRHRGYVDGFPGFIFALFSALRFPVGFFKYRSNHENSH